MSLLKTIATHSLPSANPKDLLGQLLSLLEVLSENPHFSLYILDKNPRSLYWTMLFHAAIPEPPNELATEARQSIAETINKFIETVDPKHEISYYDLLIKLRIVYAIHQEDDAEHTRITAAFSTTKPDDNNSLRELAFGYDARRHPSIRINLLPIPVPSVRPMQVLSGIPNLIILYDPAKTPNFNQLCLLSDIPPDTASRLLEILETHGHNLNDPQANTIVDFILKDTNFFKPLRFDEVLSSLTHDLQTARESEIDTFRADAPIYTMMITLLYQLHCVEEPTCIDDCISEIDRALAELGQLLQACLFRLLPE